MHPKLKIQHVQNYMFLGPLWSFAEKEMVYEHDLWIWPLLISVISVWGAST